jgi:hypothetical protein
MPVARGVLSKNVLQLEITSKGGIVAVIVW